MNNLSKLRIWLITKIAGDEPILLNWNINSDLIKGDASVIYIPLKDEKIPVQKLTAKAALTPVRNVA